MFAVQIGADPMVCLNVSAGLSAPVPTAEQSCIRMQLVTCWNQGVCVLAVH
jgi:hypothetical protein